MEWILVNIFSRKYELVGWIVEHRWWPENWEKNENFKVKHTRWEKQWNHKIYKTEEEAKDAMKQSGSWLRNQEYRYRPVYAKKIPEPPKP